MNEVNMIALNITVTSGAKINKIGKEGHLQISSHNKSIVIREDYTPILVIDTHKYLDIYELETLTDYEKIILNKIYKGLLLKFDCRYKEFVILYPNLYSIDYHKLFHIKKFITGKVTIYGIDCKCY